MCNCGVDEKRARSVTIICQSNNEVNLHALLIKGKRNTAPNFNNNNKEQIR